MRVGVKVFQCSICRKQTSLTEDTIFHSTNLPLTKWFQAMYFLAQAKNNISSLEMKRLIGVCYRTAWTVKHKLMSPTIRYGTCPMTCTGWCEMGIGQVRGAISPGMLTPLMVPLSSISML